MAELNLGYRYWLYVGNRGFDYKNFDIVLQALQIQQEETEAHLVCFGGGILTDKEVARFEELKLSAKVHQISGNDELLSTYYANAHCLVYPSKYEGFGLPPLEAMATGCPVIASNAPPMPEIIGNAGLYFNPESPQELASIIQTLDRHTRESLIDLGVQHVAKYTWELSSEQTVAFYKSLSPQ
ncbi:glycosyltransferase family 1 protein [Coraliomargarita algicola]|uniref:Glycosyltransferase family 1 protein n=1 Tax=Coraliomargarita algicola TaxID=3092156 RepID=A0ABZ0RQW5_9BACT|nr:glycosyltransferase family 1 protein [Coraliomargarita sp. J2-16]WPJ97375.1 glycosyltransferase family 1 protein [Coraliomargarita sp. J2-16]